VGRAATEAFVYSFIAILALDFVIGYLWNRVYNMIYPNAGGLI
jgi:phospholipid/cholesterol/gamma-HCH transport system permease protein